MNKLTTGLVWYDDNPKRSLAEKVALAAAHYARKHNGTAPNLCHVHPSTLDGQERQIGPIEIVPLKTVQPDYFWIGRQTPK